MLTAEDVCPNCGFLAGTSDCACAIPLETEDSVPYVCRCSECQRDRTGEPTQETPAENQLRLDLRRKNVQEAEYNTLRAQISAASGWWKPAL